MKAHSITSSAILAMLGSIPAFATTPPTVGESAILNKADSVLAESERLEGMVRRALLNGGAKPVGVSGEAIGKLVYSSYSEYPSWMRFDRTEARNSYAALRLALVAKPNRNLTVWSKMAFNHALLGYQPNAPLNQTYTPSNDSAYQYASLTGDLADKRSSLVYEDMAVGINLVAGPASFAARAGGVLWNEMSPLTIWKTQPRMFGWDYLPYELEQSTAQFYEYATIKGEKAGRAAWNKKPFQGLQLESVELPYNLYANAFYGFYEGYNKTAPWIIPVDKTNELQYTSVNGPAKVNRTFATKATGISDNYRAVWFARLAKGELPGGVTAGFNWFAYSVDKDYPKLWGYANLADNDKDQIRNIKLIDTTGSKGRTGEYLNNYYIVPKVFSVDARRTISGGWSFHADLGASYVDSIFYRVKYNITSSTRDTAYYRSEMKAKAKTAGYWEEIGRTNTGWKPALYTTVSHPTAYGDVEARTVYIAKDFHAGASNVAPLDGIFPYEANLLGPGKFAGVDNGTSYAANLMGTNIIAKFPVGSTARGHARLSFGVHSQIEKGRDMIYFPWRLNGVAFKSTLNSNFTQFGMGLLDDFLRGNGGKDAVSRDRQIRRFGDESFGYLNAASSSRGRNDYAPVLGDAGGVRADYMATYEGFMPYKLTKSWTALKTTADTVLYNQERKALVSVQDSAKIPDYLMNTKSTQNLSFDGTYEISTLWKGKRAVFLAGYVALNSVTKGFGNGIPALGTGDNVYLSGKLVRFEPVFQVTPKFYMIGLVGMETWQSSYGVAAINDSAAAPDADYIAREEDGSHLVRAPIDYTDMSYGIGFDWDMAPRASLHVRTQYFTHQDKGISVDAPKAAGRNDYKAMLSTAEIKMWF